MRVLSLFDGIGSGYLALERAGIGIEKYYASEVDKYAITIAKKNFPNIVQIGDVREIDGEQLREIDLLIGGSPCQGFSFGGKKLGFQDPRSKLFFDYLRILKQIKPKYFLLENVIMKKEFQVVISEYLGVEPIKINSDLVSAQSRNRLYWTNIPGVVLPKDRAIQINDIVEGNETDIVCGASRGRFTVNGKRQDHKMSVKGLTTQRIELRKDKKTNTLTTVRKDNLVVNTRTMEYRYFTPVEYERLQTFPEDYTEGVSKTQRYKLLGNSWTVDVIAHIFCQI